MVITQCFYHGFGVSLVEIILCQTTYTNKMVNGTSLVEIVLCFVSAINSKTHVQSTTYVSGVSTKVKLCLHFVLTLKDIISQFAMSVYTLAYSCSK